MNATHAHLLEARLLDLRRTDPDAFDYGTYFRDTGRPCGCAFWHTSRLPGFDPVTRAAVDAAIAQAQREETARLANPEFHASVSLTSALGSLLYRAVTVFLGLEVSAFSGARSDEARLLCGEPTSALDPEAIDALTGKYSGEVGLTEALRRLRLLMARHAITPLGDDWVPTTDATGVA